MQKNEFRIDFIEPINNFPVITYYAESYFVALGYCKCCGGYFGYTYHFKKNYFFWHCLYNKKDHKEPCNCYGNGSLCDKSDCEIRIKPNEQNKIRQKYFNLFLTEIGKRLFERGNIAIKICRDDDIDLFSAVRTVCLSSDFLVYCLDMENFIFVKFEYKSVSAKLRYLLFYIYARIRLFLLTKVSWLRNLLILNINDTIVPKLNFQSVFTSSNTNEKVFPQLMQFMGNVISESNRKEKEKYIAERKNASFLNTSRNVMYQLDGAEN